MSDIDEHQKKIQAMQKSIDAGAQKMTDQVATFFSLPWPRKPTGKGKGTHNGGHTAARPTPVKPSGRSKGHLRKANMWPMGGWK